AGEASGRGQPPGRAERGRLGRGRTGGPPETVLPDPRATRGRDGLDGRGRSAMGRTPGRLAPPPSALRAVSPEEPLRAEPLLRILLAGVAVAAGLTGLLLLVLPGSAGRFFSWGLAPAPL